MALGAVVAVATVRACNPLEPPNDFSYAHHLKPRVFVSHKPLVPAPGSSMIIRLEPDLEPGSTVTRAVAQLAATPSGAAATKECTAASGAFECSFKLGAEAGEQVYGGFIELSDGSRHDSRASYRFTVAEELEPNTVLPVRVPVSNPPGLADSYRMDTVWLRDPLEYSEAQFTSDVLEAMFAGLLADPVYRWRDDQLGFFLYTRPGFVESYYSGRDTRCGQNPFPAERDLPSALKSAEVIGVLHRRTTDSLGIEGTGATPTSVEFRDCAGAAAKSPDVGTFSATSGIPELAAIAKHEFGHAAFGLADEYTEPTSSRNVAPALPNPLSGECCCLVDDGGGGTGTGGVNVPGVETPIGESKRCIVPGGGVATSPSVGTQALPSCSSPLPPHCGASSDGGCPSLDGSCVRAAMWLGATPPGDARRPNIHPDQNACFASSEAAAAHPAIQDPDSSLGECRELCGPASGLCPCSGSAAFWVADINPRVPPAATPRQDAMGAVSTAQEALGGTCQWCVETSLCVRWHRARGDDAARSWELCEGPPKEATRFESLWRAIVQWVADLLRAIFGRVIFQG